MQANEPQEETKADAAGKAKPALDEIVGSTLVESDEEDRESPKVGEKRPSPAADCEDKNSPSKNQKVEPAVGEMKSEPAGQVSAEAPVAVEQ